ncbi:MAG: ATP-dependent Clp protease adaptor ClpS [Spirochaetes bacterium]|uniref:ATP-dependent Clp protease adapter protein ClpS n=1 Tax=Candidatus Gallitreponema excrementavium TaxID=2840840 RepID=A0A9D9N2X2_9SPIR|nr:ATP-dependent Clp protease adaptor ClpS [Candidatus Gallitreponema excrementavium]
MEQVSKNESKTKIRLAEPEIFKVILLNDDYTTQEFVVSVLISVFHKPVKEAESIMLSVHNSGRATVGLYSLDIAQTYVEQVHSLAQSRGFPLRCFLEKQ